MNNYEIESFRFEIFFNNAVTNRSYKRGHKSELKNLYLCENCIINRGLPNHKKQLENIKRRLSLAFNFMLDYGEYREHRERLVLMLPQIEKVINSQDISYIVFFGLEIQLKVLPKYTKF